MSLINEKEKCAVGEKQSLSNSRKYSEIGLGGILPIYNWQEYFYDMIPKELQNEANKIYDKAVEESY